MKIKQKRQVRLDEMVNIDAKVKDSNGEICRVECVYDDEILASYGGSHAEDSDFLKHGTYTVIEDIRSDYERQKLRADELEKRWSELKQMGIKTYLNLKKDKSVLAQYIGSILCVMDELEGKENVFETVQSLEDDNA